MATVLVDAWLAPAVRGSWAACLPAGDEDVRTLVSLLAGAHDVGKATPAFAVQVQSLCQVMRDHGLASQYAYPERRFLPHALAGHLAMVQWLVELGVDARLAEQLASVVGSHHGQTPTRLQINDGTARPELLGESRWTEVRRELLRWMDARVGTASRWPAWRGLDLPLPVLVGMAGLVVVADWLASNETLFPLVTRGSGEVFLSPARQQERTSRAVEDWVLPPSWSPDLPSLEGTALYAARFGWSDDRRARPVQLLAERLAREVEPGLMVVEAPTGEGKTELALCVAEVVAARWGASGVYFALPTQATSNAVLSRLARWADRLPSPPAADGPWSLALAHGRSRLNREYADMFPETSSPATAEAERVSTDDESEPGVNFVAHEWFRGRKRTLLATFGVGTIDQLLFASLQAKHLMLRHLGLAGKVVVIDEAHASDAYMNVFLDRTLEWLRAYGVPVIVLTATLPGRRRAELLSAYASPLPVSRRRGRPADRRFDLVLGDVGYPVVTTLALGADQAVVHRVAAAADRPSTTVRIETMTDDDAALVGRLRELLAGGGCALVLRNTVRAAQRTAAALRVAAVAPVTLCHSLLLAVDRAARDQSLLAMFGPEGDRPDRHIVVATQVAEQSLDIDFDVLITDLPPADLLCQRLGRVHRHRRPRPSLLTEPRCTVLLDEPGVSPPRADQGSLAVYGEAALLRTAGALHDFGDAIEVPSRVAAFVQHAYGDRPPGPGSWQEAMATADAQAEESLAERRSRAEAFLLPSPPAGSDRSLVGWLDRSVGEADPEARDRRATVRDGEEGLEVLVVPLDHVTGDVLVPPWQEGAGRRLDVRTPLSDEDARLVVSWAIRLPAVMTRGRAAAVVAELSADHAVSRWSWHRHPWVRGELLLPMRQTSEDSHEYQTTLFNFSLRYTPEQGLEVQR